MSKEEKHGWFARLHDRFLGAEHEHGRFEVRPTAESHFSWLRTRMSLERTLMSWVRTSTALIGFGFTIVQFFHSNLIVANAVPIRHPEMPRYMGLALIAAGVLALLVALWQYRAFARYLWNRDFAELAGPARAPVETPIFAVATCLLLIGCYAFLAVLIRAI
ncbi:YidH family protein [Herminiimonas glaciei]|uniref:YidH family protein n=1 Tax=Herminiimonas glaciei TaxID=523788 RepID=A0ABW2I749_9BURK